MQFTANLFSVKIDRFELADIDNDMLVNHALDTRNARTFNWKGGYKESLPEYNNNLLNSCNKFKSLYSIIEDKLNQVYHVSYNFHHKLKISQSWCSVNNEPAITIPHNHKRSVLSAVYYPQSNDEELWFITPMPQMVGSVQPQHVENLDEYNRDYVSIIVNTGDLLIFNSMLYHYIKPTEKQRISFAVDSIIENNNSEGSN